MKISNAGMYVYKKSNTLYIFFLFIDFTTNFWYPLISKSNLKIIEFFFYDSHTLIKIMKNDYIKFILHVYNI